MKTILDCVSCNSDSDTCNYSCLNSAAAPVSTDAPTPEGSSRPVSNADKFPYRHQLAFPNLGAIKMITSYFYFLSVVGGFILSIGYLIERPTLTANQRILLGARRIRMSRAIQSPEFHDVAVKLFCKAYRSRLDELNGIEGKSL